MMSIRPQDGGQGPSAPDQPPETYGTRTGAATQYGTDFEIKMCALVFLRAVQSNSSFKMRSNYGPAGDFDDIVLSYGSPGNEENILVQLKTSKNRPIDLRVSGKKSKKKSLMSHFQSLNEAKTSQYLKNCIYVFFTNAHVDLTLRVENVHSYARKLLCTTWKHNDVCQVDSKDVICEGFRDDPGAEDFLKRLLIFRNQSDLEYLDEFIKLELFKMCNGFVPEYRTIQQTFLEKIKDWWGKEYKEGLNENWEEWTKLKEKLFGQNALLKQIKFCKDSLSHLEKMVLGCKSDIILFQSDSAEAHIACSKVYQTFVRNVNLGVLFTDICEPDQSQHMFSLWSRDEWDVLVISDVTNCSQNLGDIAKYKGNPEEQNKKKIVIVSSRDAKTLGLSQVYEFGKDFIKSTFNQLDDDSRDKLQNLPVNFQGKEIALGKIIADKILQGGLLQDVLTSPEIQIGTALPEFKGIYIPRTLSKRLVVNKGIFNSNDDLYFADIKEKDLKSLVAQVRKKRLNEDLLSRIQIRRRDTLFRMMSSSPGRGHFLEVIDNSVHWLGSRGSTANIIKYIEVDPREEDDCKTLIRDIKTSRIKEDDLVTYEIVTVIVAGEPGSGKTALLLEVARKMKELNPHRWIIHIDLNKYSNILKEMKDQVTLKNVLDFLNKAANPDNSELGKQLLEYSVSESGDICILFDAFDEIVPSYTETVLAIFKFILSNFRLSTLWIASRSDVKEKLETELGSKMFTIVPLSYREQTRFMSFLWGIQKAKQFQRAILNELKFGVLVRLFSFPLHLNMICEMCSDLVTSDNFSSISLSFKIYNLYEEFTEMKFNIYFNEKLRLDNSSCVADNAKENLREGFMKTLMNCSLVALDMLDYVDEPHQSSIKEEVQKICQEIQNGKQKLGIIDGVVDGKPHFLHRTVAEYFAGQWFAKNLKETEWFIGRDDSSVRSEFFNNGFNRELASELPAHRAVLNGDINSLETHKKYLNKKDVLGRTPLHLAVQSRDKRGSIMVLELLKYGPELEIKDDQSGHTPLYCAAEAESWDVVRILLQHGARVIGKEPYLEIERREEFVKAMEDTGVANS